MGRVSTPAALSLLMKRGRTQTEAGICSRFRALRDKKGLSQVEYSKKLEISVNSLKQIESGYNAPTVAMIIRCHQKFKVSFNWIFTGKE